MPRQHLSTKVTVLSKTSLDLRNNSVVKLERQLHANGILKAQLYIKVKQKAWEKRRKGNSYSWWKMAQSHQSCLQSFLFASIVTVFTFLSSSVMPWIRMDIREWNININISLLNSLKLNFFIKIILFK